MKYNTYIINISSNIFKGKNDFIPVSPIFYFHCNPHPALNLIVI